MKCIKFFIILFLIIIKNNITASEVTWDNIEEKINELKDNPRWSLSVLIADCIKYKAVVNYEPVHTTPHFFLRD